MFSFYILWIHIAAALTQYHLPVGLIVNDPELAKTYTFAATRVAYLNNVQTQSVYTENMTDMTDNYQLSEALCSLLNKGVVAIIGGNSAEAFNTIQSFSDALRVPYIVPTSTRSDPMDSYKYDFSLAPPVMDAVIKIIDMYFWEKIYYVYDSDDGLWRLQKLYTHIQEKKQHKVVGAFRIRDVDNSYELLRNLDYEDAQDPLRRIVLDLSSTQAYQKILSQIIDVGMNRENYHYILASLTAFDLNYVKFFEAFKYGGVNITAFSIIQDHTDVYKQTEQLWDSLQSDYANLWPLRTESALMIDTVEAVYHSLQMGALRNKPDGIDKVWCRAGGSSKSDNGPRVMEQLKKSSFNGLTGGIKFDERGMRSDFKIDVRELTHKSDFKQIFSWNRRELTHRNESMYGPRQGQEVDRVQRVTTIEVSPFVMKTFNGEPAIAGKDYEGYCIDLIEKVAKRSGFEYRIEVSDDYGKVDVNGSWSGMIGELITNQSDIAVAPLTITEERERVVDFSKPFMDTGISIMIKKPDKVKPGVFSFMEPLDTVVWLCIALGFIAVSFVLFFVGRFSPFEWTLDGNDKKETKNTFTISNTMWFSLGALMQQGSDISPRSLSGRMIGSAWWFFTLIIISSYTANLAAFLTIEKMLTPIDSADDLVKQKEIKYGTLETGTSWKFFKDSGVQVFKQMYETMRQHRSEVLVTRVEEGVKKVRMSKSKYAFMLESSMNNYHNQQEPCDTMKVGENLDNKGYGIATRVKYPFREDINIAVLELREIGELHKLERKWWYDKGKCGDTDSSKDATQSALTLSNVSGIFHILIGGLVLAMLTSSLEYLAQRQLKANRAKKRAQGSMGINQNPIRSSNFDTLSPSAAYAPVNQGAGYAPVSPATGYAPVNQATGYAPVNQATGYAPEQENGGYHFAPAGQLMTFEGQARSNQTDI